MIYYGFAILLTLLAVLNRAAMPFAMTLALGLCTAIGLEDYMAQHFGAYGYMALSFIDVLMLYPLTWFASQSRTWWSTTVVALCGVSVLSSVVYWSFWLGRVDLGQAYVAVCQSVYLFEVLVLVYGGYDVGNRLSRLGDDLRALKPRGRAFGLVRLLHSLRRQQEGS